MKGNLTHGEHLVSDIHFISSAFDLQGKHTVLSENIGTAWPNFFAMFLNMFENCS